MSSSCSKKVILLVEDEALIAMNEAAMLKKYGYEVITAYNAQKAIDTVAKGEVDLVLMDIDLGEGKMDGTEAAEIILQEKDIPIVFLSSHTEPEVVEKTEGITSYGYIVKNSGETVLLTSIRMAFRLYDAHIELKRQKENHLEREELYRNLMDNSIDGVELLDEEGRFLNVNKRECEMTGYSREELLRMSIADLDPNFPADGFYRFWNEKPKNFSFLFETLHRHKNGTLIPVEVNGIFFKVNNKKFLYGVVRDITERKQAEKEIKEREENLRATLHSIGDAVIAADREGKITQINPVAARLCGWTNEEALGKKLEEVFTIKLQKKPNPVFTICFPIEAV